MLGVDDFLFPLLLGEGVAEHDQGHCHEDPDAPNGDLAHEDDNEGEDNPAHDEHQRVYYSHIPWVVPFEPIEESLVALRLSGSFLESHIDLSQVLCGINLLLFLFNQQLPFLIL